MSGRQRFRRLFRLGIGRDVNLDIDDEMAFHLAERAAAHERAGLSPEEARARAEAEYGDVASARAELAAIDRRSRRRRTWLEAVADVSADLRLAVRRLRREPGFLAAAVLTLGLGIGGNLAIVAVADSVLLHPLPYPESKRLVYLWETHGGDVSDRSEASYPDFEDLRAGSGAVFAGLEGFDPGNATLVTGDRASRVRVTSVTAKFLDLLGARPAAGRFFAEGEDAPGGTPVAVLAHHFWRSAFDADSEVVGTSLTLDGESFTIVGVVQPGFHFAPGGDPDVWVPLGASAELRTFRFNHWLRPIARLRDGVTMRLAEATVAGVMDRLAAEYPETNAGRSAALVPLAEEVTGGVRPIVMGLVAALGLVLLIVCANLASLTLARSLARAGELAVRAALGASRLRLARYLLTESLLIAVLGAVLGAVLAGPALHLTLGAIPEGTRNTMPYLDSVVMGPSTLAVGAALGLVAGLLVGAASLLVLQRPATLVVRDAGTRLVDGGRGRLRAGLVVGQVALTTGLLVGGGLLGRSLLALLAEDPGFATVGIATMRVALDAPRYQEDAARVPVFEALLERARALPGVRSAGAVSRLPLNGGGTNTFSVEGGPEPDPANRPEAMMRGVMGDYFATLGIPLVAGRVIGPDDHRLLSPVIMMNRSLAERLWPGESAVGKAVRFYAFPDTAWEVVGVVGDVKTDDLDALVPPTIYYSALTGNDNRLAFVVAGAGDPARYLAPLRAALAELDPEAAGYSAQTMAEYLAQSPAVVARRLSLTLVAVFGVLALILVVVGIYGVQSFQVTTRRRQIGLKMALGATAERVLRGVLGEGARLALAGIVIGLGAAILGGRILGSLLYGVHPADPVTLAAVAVGLLGVGLASCWLPARRAARVDPMEALRAE